MDSNDVVACVAIGAGTAVTITNIVLNGDGVSIAALFALIGTALGFVFGVKVGEK
jgi:hypothetical protein